MCSQSDDPTQHDDKLRAALVPCPECGTPVGLEPTVERLRLALFNQQPHDCDPEMRNCAAAIAAALAASATDEQPRDDLRTRALKRIVMARDGRAEGLRIKRFSAAREADLLAYAASVPDEDILGWQDTGPAILRWIRTHQPDEGETPVRMIPDAVVGSTFAEVLRRTDWRIELFWNGAGGWFTARLISRTDRDGHGAYPGGYLVPFDDPIGASGATPWEALANLGEAVLEWA